MTLKYGLTVSIIFDAIVVGVDGTAFTLNWWTTEYDLYLHFQSCLCHFSQGLLLFMELVMEKREEKFKKKYSNSVKFGFSIILDLILSARSYWYMVLWPILNLFLCVCRNFRGKLQNVYLHQREWRKRQRVCFTFLWF